MKSWSNRVLCLLMTVVFTTAISAFAAPDYAVIHEIFQKQCVECHAAQDPEGGFVMETHETVLKGGKEGVVVIPGKASDSLLVKFLEGNSGRKGKNQFMPPGKRDHLPTKEIALIREWIDAGAKPPAQAMASRKELKVPSIAPKKEPRRAIKSVAWSEAAGLIAVARYGEVELFVPGMTSPKFKLEGHVGAVNAVAFSRDGKHLFAAAGQTGLFGEVRHWDVATGKFVKVFEGHLDALYAVAVSPDGNLLASGGYDQQIILWDVKEGKPVRTLKGHNGCVYDLDFRSDGKILASVSADRTAKLWDVASGERRDTLSQSLKEIYSVAFSPDGKRLAAAGVDNRIRVWEVSEKATETTNPLLYSKFGHEGAILNLAFSPDGKWLVSTAEDRTVKLWDFRPMREVRVLEKQTDWAPGITFAKQGQQIVVGRLDGTLGLYPTVSGETSAPASRLTQTTP
ncbi:MAG TPA: c-type cytochrome domain-containing protein [Verrucomicrobiae bacterium]